MKILIFLACWLSAISLGLSFTATATTKAAAKRKISTRPSFSPSFDLLEKCPQGTLTPSAQLRMGLIDDTPLQETALHRMRRRKSRILKRRKAKVTGYLFALWYVLCVVYNLFSKRALNMAPDLAWATAWVQMTGGLSYVLPLWYFNKRPKPKISGKDARRLFPVALLHSLVHIGGVVSMGAGAVSFTYIVKASEPAVSAALAALTGTFLYWSVYLTLVPVIAGVAMVRV